MTAALAGDTSLTMIDPDELVELSLKPLAAGAREKKLVPASAEVG